VVGTSLLQLRHAAAAILLILILIFSAHDNAAFVHYDLMLLLPLVLH